jgi:hypothetical protein
METLPVLLKYVLYNAAATAAGIFYWMAVENMQPLEIRQRTHQKLVFVFLISLVLTPFGAWMISSIFRMRKIAPTLLDGGKMK